MKKAPLVRFVAQNSAEKRAQEVSEGEHQKSEIFEDAEFCLVIPPLTFSGKVLEYCKQLTAERNVEEGREFTLGPKIQLSGGTLPIVRNERSSVLQGELLDVAAIITYPRDGPVDPRWRDKYLAIKATADICVTPDAEGPSGKDSSFKSSALSSQLWEAQTFPIDAPDHVAVSTHFVEESKSVVHAFQIPLTINPKHLEKSLNVIVTLTSPERSKSDDCSDSSDDDTASDPGLPLSGILHGSTVRDTRILQDLLQAPTPYASLSVPFSSALTGSVHTPWRGFDPSFIPPGFAHSVEPGTEEELSRNIELLDLAIVQPALRDLSRIDYPFGQNTGESLILSCPVDVQKPLSLLTNLIGSLMYTQIENVARDVTVVIENIHIRSVRTYTQGEVPFELASGEQYSLLLCPDEDLLQSTGAPSWESSRPRGGSVSSAVGGGPDGSKKVLPLCVKWRIGGSGGPSVWSQFGADYQLATRTPIEISISCLSYCPPGGILTALLTVTNHEQGDIVDATAYLPKDLLYHSAGSASGTGKGGTGTSGSGSVLRNQDPPPLIPLLTRRPLGRILKGGSQSTHLQFLTTRLGLHSFPPVMILDAGCDRRFIAKGGQVLVS